MLPKVPCFELISSAEQLPNTKFPKEKLTAYITKVTTSTAEHTPSEHTVPEHTVPEHTAKSGSQLILPGSKPELIVKFLEELWNAK